MLGSCKQEATTPSAHVVKWLIKRRGTEKHRQQLSCRITLDTLFGVRALLLMLTPPSEAKLNTHLVEGRGGRTHHNLAHLAY